MKVFDLHSDLFTDIAFRKSNGEKNVFDRLHYPRLRKGLIDSVICVFWVEPEFRKDPLARFNQLLQYVMEDLSTSKHANICISASDFLDSQKSAKVNIILGLEGMTFMKEWGKDSINENVESAFEELHEKNIRHAIYAWNENNFLASGTGAYNETIHKGLSVTGKQATTIANAHHWIMDASHLDEQSFWDLYNMSDQPIIASHSNAKAICDHERNLTDEQMRAIASRGGLIGLNAHNEFIDKNQPSADRLIDHAVHMANVVGPEHIGFGFDFLDFLTPHDLGDDFSGATCGLERVEQVPALLEKMKNRGFSSTDLEKISFSNAFNFISKQLKG
ncbi:membrane dipeptidase [Sporosarcina sp. Sa2YVA2]|uniref:Membrane dipeptidase n=1 Tax=Sporosarcina quadrami TaxID=2762234 RepID=A0ABR8UCQ6_9BACL|nr:membrane dipeptidase [Sporosarcina quadrami]MBD7985817.1 membrane dipeptidase [Sporosarcina quadrami]